MKKTHKKTENIAPDPQDAGQLSKNITFQTSCSIPILIYYSTDSLNCKVQGREIKLASNQAEKAKKSSRIQQQVIDCYGAYKLFSLV